MRRLLIVDDEPDILETFVEALPVFMGEPLDIEVALSGEEARTKLSTRGFDAVLTDEKMPGIRGTQLLTWIHREHPKVVRILMTAYGGAGLALPEGNGAQLVVAKPLDLAHLAEDLRALLNAAPDGRSAPLR